MASNRQRWDEFDVDFDDTRQFTAWRYDNEIQTITSTLTEEEQLIVAEPRTWQNVRAEITSKLINPKSSALMKRVMGALQPLPRSVATLNGTFITAVAPHDVQFDCLWGLVYLNLQGCTCFPLRPFLTNDLQESYASDEKMQRTAEWLGRLRKVVELFNRCVDVCEDFNEPRLAMIEVYIHTFHMLEESLRWLKMPDTDPNAARIWVSLSASLDTHNRELEATVKHLNEITSYSKVNLERQVRNLSLRHAPVPESLETCAFPVTVLPHQPNENFYGRKTELDKIKRHLGGIGPNDVDVPDLRTYTIYGRRGVGKTEIALQYAHDNPSEFEAIFWIGCETSLSLRQSFTNVAVALNLPGANQAGHHEENLLAVQKWLKLTTRRWLLIFDNAEKEAVLKSYWPVGAKGSILITSRKYYNFMKDMQRKGDTVKPFNEQQSYELLLQLLGEKWQAMDRRGVLRQSEISAAQTLLSKIGGLALAIQQAAILILNPDIGGSTISGALEVFNSNSNKLPQRPHGDDRNSIIHALDTLWNMSFSVLSKDARAFLSVLSMLSPDVMLIDLFLPQRQAALNGKLSFIKRPQKVVDEQKAGLASVIESAPALDNVIAELLEKGLIKKENRVISVHRVVQEAMNYHSIEDLQASFDAAVALIYEAFPKKETGERMYKEWPICQNYISHGVHIGEKYKEYTGLSIRTNIASSDTLTALLANCAWYLTEIGDWDTCLRLTDIASEACADKNSPRYANIRNSAGCCYFDMNRLDDCRRDWQIVLRILEGAFLPDDPKIAHIVHNLGNLESGQGNYFKAKEHFDRAVKISRQDPKTVSEIAVTYLCVGRLYYFQRKFADAQRKLAEAEAIFVRSAGENTQLMAFVHFAYGNIMFASQDKNHLENAKRAYSDALKIALAETPIHAITAAIYYRLGCVEFSLRHHEVAKNHLEKAKIIAEMKSPNRDDGTVARILWKMSRVLLESDLLAGEEAEQLRNRAEVARIDAVSRGEGTDVAGQKIVQILDEEGEIDLAEDDEVYDALVPIFYR